MYIDDGEIVTALSIAEVDYKTGCSEKSTSVRWKSKYLRYSKFVLLLSTHFLTEIKSFLPSNVHRYCLQCYR